MLVRDVKTMGITTEYPATVINRDNFRTGVYLFMHTVSSRILL